MESKSIEITIDGKKCPGRQGEYILAIAQRNGLFIPALCAHPLLQPYGACRLCLVEIEQNKRKRVVAACAYPAQAGLEVRTSTEKIAVLRRGIMELLLARCPGNELLRDLAVKLGVKSSRFPTLAAAGEKCILCGLCVRVCNEVAGAAAIGFSNRGMERRVDSPFSLGSDVCLGCSACVAICPTGAIQAEYKGDTLNLSPFKTSVKVQRCISCGKPLAPAPLMELVKTKALLPLLAANLCPDCKADRRAQAMATAAAARVR